MCIQLLPIKQTSDPDGEITDHSITVTREETIYEFKGCWLFIKGMG